MPTTMLRQMKAAIAIEPDEAPLGNDQHLPKSRAYLGVMEEKMETSIVS